MDFTWGSKKKLFIGTVDTLFESEGESANIERKKLVAMLRLRDSRSGFKHRMCNGSYNMETWPLYILRILFGDENMFTYHNQLSLACFMHANGFKCDKLAINQFKMYNKHWPKWVKAKIVFFQFGKMFENLNNSGEIKKKIVPKVQKIHLPLKNTAKIQERNKCRAMVRLQDTKTRYRMKKQIEEMFYSTDEWPVFILRIILGMDDFDYGNRLALATFFHGNGLRDRDEAENILLFYNKKNGVYSKKWMQRRYQFRALFDWLEKACDRTDVDYHTMREKYYFFSMQSKLTMFYDGFVRGPTGEKTAYKAYYE